MRLRTAFFRAVLLAVLAGGVVWAAHPPIAAGFLAYLVVPLLLLALALVADAHGVVRFPGDAGTRTHADPEGVGESIDRSPRWGRRLRDRGHWPAALGFLAGLVAFLPMLVWLVPPAGVAALVLVSLVQACWYALTAHLLAYWVRSRWVVLAAPVLWTGMEAWRGTVPLGGFGWGELGYAHAHGSWLLPLARLVGTSGLTFFTVLVGALAYRGLRRGIDARLDGSNTAGVLRAAAPAVAGVVVIGVVATLVRPAAPAPSGQVLDVLALQGNDGTPFHGTPAEEDEAIARWLLAQTTASVAQKGPPDLTVWPENSIDRDPYRATGGFLRPYVVEAARAVRGNLLFGAILDGPDPSRTFANAAVMADAEGRPQAVYVKRAIVPFGEYIPFRSVLGFIPPLAQVPRDAVRGTSTSALPGRTTNIAVMICFETLFSDLLLAKIRSADAGVVVAITNDASFKRLWESDQHIAQSQLRAVETGRWVVHAAQSGRSAIVDPDGHIHQRTGMYELATTRADIPVVTEPTPYLRTGNLVGGFSRWAALALAVFQVLMGRRVKRRTPPHGAPVQGELAPALNSARVSAVNSMEVQGRAGRPRGRPSPAAEVAESGG